jgi:hypothetical protein
MQFCRIIEGGTEAGTNTWHGKPLDPIVTVFRLDTPTFVTAPRGHISIRYHAERSQGAEEVGVRCRILACGPESPTDADKASEDSWLKFLDRLTIKYGKRRPDYLMLLRERGALTYAEQQKIQHEMG